MDIRRSRRLGAIIASSLCLTSASAAVHASTVAAFSFDDANGVFDASPSLLAGGLAGATWQDDAGRLSDLAGNPGRALAASGFTGTNRLHLVLTQSGVGQLALSLLHFDIRGSASGPNAWTLSHGGDTLATGAITASFRGFDVPLSLVSEARELVLDLSGNGATAITGTLRLDNVRLEGELRPVPLPGSLFLIATPLLGALLARLRERCAQALGAGHSRQPSSKGKYRPSMIGRPSRLAMMRA